MRSNPHCGQQEAPQFFTMELLHFADFNPDSSAPSSFSATRTNSRATPRRSRARRERPWRGALTRFYLCCPHPILRDSNFRAVHAISYFRFCARFSASRAAFSLASSAVALFRLAFALANSASHRSETVRARAKRAASGFRLLPYAMDQSAYALFHSSFALRQSASAFARADSSITRLLMMAH